ncbi:hypothetical protein [Alteromonas aestuariivivens]|nr:hypothetical protein [Alteromonas aestuariivivens]
MAGQHQSIAVDVHQVTEGRQYRHGIHMGEGHSAISVSSLSRKKRNC